MRRLPVTLLLVLAITALATGCESGISVSKSNGPVYRGAVLFNEHCSGCHSLAAAAAEGSRPPGLALGPQERTNGPNLNQRHENRDDVLYAIRNGGFSGAIMPANIVVGQDAQDVALFVERYAGSQAKSSK